MLVQTRALLVMCADLCWCKHEHAGDGVLTYVGANTSMLVMCADLCWCKHEHAGDGVLTYVGANTSMLVMVC